MSDPCEQIEYVARCLAAFGHRDLSEKLTFAAAALRSIDAAAEIRALEAVVRAVEIDGYGRAGAIDYVRNRIAELKKGGA